MQVLFPLRWLVARLLVACHRCAPTIFHRPRCGFTSLPRPSVGQVRCCDGAPITGAEDADPVTRGVPPQRRRLFRVTGILGGVVIGILRAIINGLGSLFSRQVT